MTLIFSRILEVVKVHVHANFIKLSAAGDSWVDREWKLSYSAENNTAAASNNLSLNLGTLINLCFGICYIY